MNIILRLKRTQPLSRDSKDVLHSTIVFSKLCIGADNIETVHRPHGIVLGKPMLYDKLGLNVAQWKNNKYKTSMSFPP